MKKLLLNYPTLTLNRSLPSILRIIFNDFYNVLHSFCKISTSSAKFWMCVYEINQIFDTIFQTDFTQFSVIFATFSHFLEEFWSFLFSKFSSEFCELSNDFYDIFISNILTIFSTLKNVAKTVERRITNIV